LAPDISGNGRRIAYRSNQTGRDEIYVAPFPGPGAAKRVSTRGGQNPKWRGDGKELFYVTPANAMMSLDVDPSGAEFVWGTERQLFTKEFERVGQSWYDVSPNAQRFLVNLRIASQQEEPPLTLVVNWPEAVRK
jgi:eukaryotic-like serine/threonine-protein kinase